MDVQNNRLKVIQHFKDLPDSSIRWTSDEPCMPCAKSQIMYLFTGDSRLPIPRTIPPVIDISLDMTVSQFSELERRYEGFRKKVNLEGESVGSVSFHRHTFAEVADWLQTLPGWPQIVTKPKPVIEIHEREVAYA